MRIRAAAAFLETTPLDFAGNARRAGEALRRARRLGAQAVCLPELCLSGYGCEDWFLSPAVQAGALRALEELLPHSKGMIAVAGLPFAFEGALYNCAAVMADGGLLGLVPKQFLADDGIHYEPRWFKAWSPGRRVRARALGREIPFGDWIFAFGQVRLGLEICHDAWVADRPCGRLKARGANLIFCPSASHFALGKFARRRQLVEQALKQGLAYVYANLMGNEAGRVIYDGGAMLADGRGGIVYGARFSYEQAGADAADLELAEGASGEGVVAAALPSPPDGPPGEDAHARSDGQLESEEEEFTRACCLGLWGYLRKSKAKGFTLSLSGGADSAACAVLVWALRRLGPDADIPLTCAYQATANSSPQTRAAARAVAQAVGARFVELDVEGLVQEYRRLAEGALGRRLSWEKDDLTLQNLQARVRAPFIWTLANAENHLLLVTSNRSEAATGYATMDGDMSGGLAPLAGIGKHFLRRWLQRMEQGGLCGLPPLPALAAVNALAPTAELRPPQARQTDEGDLMPYEVLDCLERLAVRDRLGPRETLERACQALPGRDRRELAGQVARFFRLWARSQWKRERAAPSFHVDDHNVDPRTWCRFPIFSSGFEEELAELEKGEGA